MKENPCRGCDQRSVHCHETCPAYAHYAEDVAREMDKRWLQSLSRPLYGNKFDQAYR